MHYLKKKKYINWRCFWILKCNETINMQSRKVMENTEVGKNKTEFEKKKKNS